MVSESFGKIIPKMGSAVKGNMKLNSRSSAGMDRRSFIGGGLSAALLAGCLSARGVKGVTPKPTRRTIAVGAERSFRVLHASDTHVALMDDSDRADASRAVYETMRPKTFGYHAEEYLVGTFGYAQEEGIPLLHTGDLIDYIGKANLAAAKRAFAGADAMACPGNHEWEYLLRVEDPPVMRPRYYDEVCAAFPNDLTVASRILNGVNFVLLDNADYQVPPDRATRVEAEVKKGLPVVLCCHIPFETPDLRRLIYDRWRNPYSSGNCCQDESCFTGAHPINAAMRATHETRDFFAWMKAQSGIRAVLAGHHHFEASSRLTPTLTEYLAGGNYCGECTEITFT